MKKSSIIRLAKIIVVPAGVALVTLFFADVFLWAFFPIHLELAATRHVVHQDVPGLKSDIVYERNQYGFRSLSMHSAEKPGDTIRIFCLGASTTDQVVQNTEDTWCALLEKKLNKEFSHRKLRIETASLGRGGWKAIDLYIWARENIERFRPDIAILSMGINDLAWNGGPEYSYTSLEDVLQRRAPKRAKKRAVRVAEKSACQKYSQICRRVILARERVRVLVMMKTGRAVEWVGSKLPRRRRDYQRLPRVVRVVRTRDPIVEFGDAMDALLDLLRQSGIEVLVLGQPVLWKEEMTRGEIDALWFRINSQSGSVRPSGGWLVREMARYNRVQEEVAVRHGAVYIDLDREIPKTLEYFYDDCHYTDIGSEKIASVIYPAVEDQVQSMLPN